MATDNRVTDIEGVQDVEVSLSPPSLNDTLQTASSRGRLTMALAVALGLSVTACENGSSSDSTTENTTPDDGQEMADGDGDGDTQDTGMDMMNEVPDSPVMDAYEYSVAPNMEALITGTVMEGSDRVFVYNPSDSEGLEIPPEQMKEADLNQDGTFSYSAGLGEYIFVVQEGELFSLPSDAVKVMETAPDPCAEIMCGSNGTCVDGACNCDEGYTDVDDVCEDITPPEAPVITTNEGDSTTIFSSVLELEGTCSADVVIVEWRIDGGEWVVVEDYVPGLQSWSLSGELPELDAHNVDIRTRDAANNASQWDTITVVRAA